MASTVGRGGENLSSLSTQLRRLNLQTQVPSLVSHGHNAVKMPPTDFIMSHGTTQSLNTDELISLADDLIQVLDPPRDLTALLQAKQDVSRLQARCDEDLSEYETLFKVIQENVSECLQRVEVSERQGVTNEELEYLKSELDDQLQNEQQLKQTLRKIEDQMDSLEMQRVRIEGHKEALEKAKKEELRVQSEISMYASVTKIIPDLSEVEKNVGHIVDREKRIVEKFEFDPAKMSDIEICNRLWKMGDF